MSNSCCPTCGRKLTATRLTSLPERAELDQAFVDRALSKDAYFAACKRIGLRDDVRFFLRVTGDALPDTLRQEAVTLLDSLETRASKPADAKAINSLRDRYRMTLPRLIRYATTEPQDTTLHAA